MARVSTAMPCPNLLDVNARVMFFIEEVQFSVIKPTWMVRQAAKAKATCLLVGLTLFLPLSIRAWPQAAPLPQLQAADPYFEDLFHRSGSEGMVVVIVRGGEVWMQSYGQTAPRSHEKPNG